MPAAVLASGNIDSGVKQCTYTTYQWNTIEKKAVDIKTVRRPYSKLEPEEIDPVTGCTVCREDQVTLTVGSIPAFQVCRKIADEIVAALTHLIEQQLPLKQIVGYRVGKTRGGTDEEGNRTMFSNHSFGSALDINPQNNGLYDNCIEFGPGCRLIRGGEWHPDNPASLTAGGEVVRAFRRMGFRWGGEIRGRQKDFMHFSPSGY